MKTIKTLPIIALSSIAPLVVPLVTSCNNGQKKPDPEPEPEEGLSHNFLDAQGKLVLYEPKYSYSGEDTFADEGEVFDQYAEDASANPEIFADDYINGFNEVIEMSYDNIIEFGGTVDKIEVSANVTKIVVEDNITKLTGHLHYYFGGQVPMLPSTDLVGYTSYWDIDVTNVSINYNEREQYNTKESNEAQDRRYSCDYDTAKWKVEKTDWLIIGKFKGPGTEDQPEHDANFNYTNWDDGDDELNELLGEIILNTLTIDDPHYVTNIDYKG